MMANPLYPSLRGYIDSNDADAAKTILQDIVSAISTSRLATIELVQLLQDDLITDENNRRRAATRLLAEVMEEAPGVLSQNDLQHFTTFFSARLSDWPAVAPAALGCTTLLSRGGNGQVPLQESQALEIIKAFLTTVHVQSLSQPERHACLTMWLTALKVWGVIAARNDMDLVEGTIAAMDGEKDPRCLLLAFECVQVLLGVHDTPGVPSEPLDAACDELFDVVACYFPVSFTPPKDNPHGITREALLHALHGSMTCSNRFAPFCLPLIIEKLASTSKSAKEDSMLLLWQSFTKFKAFAFAPHLTKLWSILKTEILSPASASPADRDELAAKQAYARQAGAALAEGIRAFSPAEADEQLDPGSLLALVMEDAILAELFDALESGTGRGGVEERRRACAANIAAAAASASASAASRLLPRLLASSSSAASSAASPQPPASIPSTGAAPGSDPPEVEMAAISVNDNEFNEVSCVGLAVALQSLHAVLAAMSAAVACGAAGAEGLGRVVSRHSQEVMELMVHVAAHVAPSQKEQLFTGAMDAYQEVLTLTALLWSVLLSFPQLLTGEQLEVAAEQLANLASDSAAGKKVVLSAHPDTATSAAEGAVAALKLLAKEGNTGIVCSKVIPKLVSKAVGVGLRVPSEAAMEVLLQLSTPSGPEWLAAQQNMLPHILDIITSGQETVQQEVVASFLIRTAEAAAGPLDQLPTPYPHAVSEQCTQVALHILDALSTSNTTKEFDHHQSDHAIVLDACCSYISALLPHCSEEHQKGVAGSALALLRQGASSVLLPLGGAVVVALRPQVLQDASFAPQGPPLAGDSTLVAAVVAAEKGSRGLAALQEEVHAIMAVALGTVAGKLPPDTLDAFLQPLLEDLFKSSVSTDTRSSSLCTLSWLARATAMRGHPTYLQILKHTLHNLSLPSSLPPSSSSPPLVPAPASSPSAAATTLTPTPSGSQSQTADPRVSSPWLAARILRTMASLDASHGSLRLSKSSHCHQKVLWQQRTFTQCFQEIQDRLSNRRPTAPSLASTHGVPATSGLAGSSSLPSASQHQEGGGASWMDVDWSGVTMPHCGKGVADNGDGAAGGMDGSGIHQILLAAGCLIASVPPRVYRTFVKDVPGVLLEAMPLVAQEFLVWWRWLKAEKALVTLGSRQVAERSVVEIREVMTGCLMVLGDYLMDAGVRGELEGQVDGVISVLVDLAGLTGAAAVRESALQCLVALMELPYHLLHPHKRKVLQAAVAALDDNVRSVRQAAVKCRAVWTSS